MSNDYGGYHAWLADREAPVAAVQLVETKNGDWQRHTSPECLLILRLLKGAAIFGTTLSLPLAAAFYVAAALTQATEATDMKGPKSQLLMNTLKALNPIS